MGSRSETVASRLEIDIPVDVETAMTFSPTTSHSPGLQPPSASTHENSAAQQAPGVIDERTSLLGKKERKPFYRARPLWIVPFALLSSISRGMTLAPRVQVYTQLSCNVVHRNYNHTGSHFEHLLFSPVSSISNATLDASLPQLLRSQVDHIPLPVLLPEVPPSSYPPRSDPPLSCAHDPDVSSGAARLQTAFMVIMGVLSALTTGWWGRLSERYGRTKVLAASSFGLMVTDAAFLLSVQPSTSPVHTAHHLPPHILLLVAPFVEGLFGGFTTLTAATSAYISDCTSDGSRASIFSRFAGVQYAGFALGPIIGAAILRYCAAPDSATGQVVPGPKDGVPGVMPVFFAAMATTIVNFVLAVFVFPESVHKAHRRAAERISASMDEHSPLPTKQISIAKRIFGPLGVFAPSKTLAIAGGTQGRDWSLTWLALGLFAYLLSAGIFQIKYLYAENAYGWNSEQLSYYISFVGGLRAVNMLIIMPFLIARFKPAPPASTEASSSTPAPSQAHTIAFDLRLARTALLLDFISHTLVSLPITNGAATFVTFTGLSSLAAATVPSVHSLALSLFNRNPRNVEMGVGALFGALSFLQALGQMILGPLLFGLVFSNTVAKFPKGIFVVASGLVTFGLMCLMLVHHGPRAPKRKIDTKGKGPAVRRRERERGRSRVVKHVGDR